MWNFADTIYTYASQRRHDDTRLLFVMGHLNQELFRVSRARFAREFLGKESRKTSLEYIPKKLEDARKNGRKDILDAYDKVIEAVNQHVRLSPTTTAPSPLFHDPSSPPLLNSSSPPEDQVEDDDDDDHLEK